MTNWGAKMEAENILKRIEDLQRELEYVRRDLMHLEKNLKEKTSLFGTIRGGDITDEMIKEAKKDLFIELEGI